MLLFFFAHCEHYETFVYFNDHGYGNFRRGCSQTVLIKIWFLYNVITNLFPSNFALLSEL